MESKKEMQAMSKAKLLSMILALSFLLMSGLVTLAVAMNVTLAWDANSEAVLAGYKIYYDTDVTRFTQIFFPSNL